MESLVVSTAFVSIASAVLIVSVSQDTRAFSAMKKSTNALQILAATAALACKALILSLFSFLFSETKKESFNVSVASFFLESAAKIQSNESNVVLVFVRATALASKQMSHLSSDAFVSLVLLAKDSGNNN